VEPFYFTPFGRKRLQTASKVVGEALPNGTLTLQPLFNPNINLKDKDDIDTFVCAYLSHSIRYLNSLIK
jgi:hypothetical protein